MAPQTPHEERIEAASPTLLAPRLVDLVRLRLDVLRLPAPVERIVLVLESRPVAPRQTEWIPSPGRTRARDAVHALARVRASFGEESVTRARLVDTCLPERRYLWEPLRELPPPRGNGDRDDDDPARDDAGGGGSAPPAPLVRSVLAQPLRLSPFVPALQPGGAESVSPPGRVRTGWWDATQDRDYHWLETPDGEILWIFRDRASAAWYLHGVLD